MKKNVIFLLPLLLMPFVSCAQKEDVDTLIIYNWEDYIFLGDDETPGTVEQFAAEYEKVHGKKIDVQYYTFETNENMLNVLRTGKSHYDLICPSDYVIQKMIREGMCEKIPEGKLETYKSNCSPYIRNLFENTKVVLKDSGTEVSWSDYAIPYFWGTMGFMYDPDVVGFEASDASWNMFLDETYKGLFTLKDSVRDTYVAGILGAYIDEKFEFDETHKYSLNDLIDMYAKGDIDDQEYQSYINIVINAIDDDDLEMAKNFLLEAKKYAYGFEVDSGKSDIVTGKIGMNFCWSGDAVYAMDCAEEDNDLYLNYAIPKEGSNVWFDGWVMPKGANVDLACEFLDFISRPDIAALNMNEVGYTSSIAGDDIFLQTIDWYGTDAVYSFDDEQCLILDEDNNYQMIEQNEIDSLLDNEEIYAYDLTYFFGDTIDDKYKTNGKIIVYSDEINRQFSAQYPSLDELARCGIMEDFGDRNPYVLQTWSIIKATSVQTWEYFFAGILIIAFIAYSIITYNSKKARIARHNKNKK